MTLHKNHVGYFQVLKAVACFAIVLLHTFFGAAGSFECSDIQHFISVSVKNCMTWAVPCFVMVTGALLLNPEKHIETKRIFTRYIKRMAAAIIAFTFIFELCDVLILKKSFGIYILTESIVKIFTNGSWSHMWYLYMMLAVYLMLPIYKKITQASGDKDIRYLLAIYGIFLSVLPTVEALTSWNVPFYIMAATIYPFYLFAGYALYNEIIKINKIVSLIIIIVSLGLTVFLTYYTENNEADNLKSLLSNYSFTLTAINSIAVFSLFSQIDFNREKALHRISNVIAKCSFGIYLVHMVFLKIIFVGMKANPYQFGGIPVLLITSIIVFVVSFAVIWLLKKIPFVRDII